ncbi:MAG: hypothetical protein BRC25_02410 [Parcubacteria group bacterium SW_6_46_9]|nr:MAG: hypothetical protein BRC25_02410 [Parcubacteria group bacterium SW_6_46_9]
MTWLSKSRQLRPQTARDVFLFLIVVVVVSYYLWLELKKTATGILLVAGIAFVINNPFGKSVSKKNQEKCRGYLAANKKQDPFNPNPEPPKHELGDLSGLPSNYTPGPDNHPGLSVSGTTIVIKEVNNVHGNLHQRRN